MPSFPFSRSLSISVCVGGALALAACSGGSSDPSGGADASDPSGGADARDGVPSECESVCAAKLAECGAPPGNDDPCPMVCASLTTDGELSCLSQSSCLELSEDYEHGEIPCDGEDGMQPACDPADPPRCDGNAVVTCEEIAGMPTVVTETCGMYEACEEGACVSTLECLPIDARDCDALNDGNGPGQCCDGAVCFGEIDDSGEQYHRCCVQVDSDVACTADTDCCGHSADNEFTPRCIEGYCHYPI